MNKTILILLFLITLFITSCTKPEDQENEVKYQKITVEAAKSMIDQDPSVIILDVRRQDEYDEGHIPNAILIPDYKITELAESILKDKNQTILIYCRSGNRSKKAALNLIDLSYTKVYDFGGIIDWPYEIVK